MIKQKLKNLIEKINKHKVITITGLGLTGLVALTSLKDNVHFGGVSLHNPQENHYAWGIFPLVGVEGTNVKGNFYSIGLIGAHNSLNPNSTITGNMKAYGLLFGGNVIEENSTINGNIDSKGFASETPIDIKLGTNVEIGLKDYVVNKETKKGEDKNDN